MTNVEVVHSVYTKLENRPGTLDRAAKVLGAKQMNIDAISLETSGNNAYARFLTHKPREAVEVLKSNGIDAYESQMVVTTLSNRPGELARATAELAAAGLNIEGILTTPEGRLAFRTNDIERTAQILRKL
ncbi:MAG: ACT domain-containing protein [Candidatus Thermoplasmatota archaeon]